MPSREDLHAGQAIANWNLANGAILTQVAEACGALSAACDFAIASPSAASYAAVRSAGQALALICTKALAGPFAGVQAFDEPRQAALSYYKQAGELTMDMHESDEGHQAGEAAKLLNQGTQVTATATQYAQDLAQRLGVIQAP